MLKRAIWVLLVLLPLVVAGQKRVLEIRNELKEGNRKVHTAFPIVDESNGNFALFLDDNKKTYGFLFDSDYTPLGKFASEGLPRKYNDIIGYSISGTRARLFLKDEKKRIFGSIGFDFENGETREIIYDLTLRGEQYLEGFNDGNDFYMITVTRNSSKLNFYSFRTTGSYEKKTIDFSREVFVDKDGTVSNLYDIMNIRPTGFSERGIPVAEVEVHMPNPIESVYRWVKLYPKKGRISLTIDHKITTYILDIEVPSLEYKVANMVKPKLESGKSNNNSFIFRDHIYQLVASKEEMKFAIYNIESGEEMKNIHLKKEDSITFKNSPIIQEKETEWDRGGGIPFTSSAKAKEKEVLESHRELDKTSQFLRKLNNGTIGISVSQTQDEDYVVTLGAIEQLSGGGAPVMMPGVGAVGGMAMVSGNFAVSYNPAFFAYSGYRSTKATRIECLFNKDFEHVKGEVPQNVFDTINDTADKISAKKAETIFEYQGDFIWGYYNNVVNNYSLYRF